MHTHTRERVEIPSQKSAATETKDPLHIQKMPDDRPFDSAATDKRSKTVGLFIIMRIVVLFI